MREKPTAWPKSGRANLTLAGAFGRVDPLGTGEIYDCRMIPYLRSLSPSPARTARQTQRYDAAVENVVLVIRGKAHITPAQLQAAGEMFGELMEDQTRRPRTT
jgi:hypothetical protein